MEITPDDDILELLQGEAGSLLMISLLEARLREDDEFMSLILGQTTAHGCHYIENDSFVWIYDSQY